LLAELHSVVCVKVVPKPEEIRVDPETHLLDRSHARSEINPPDMNALEMALSLKDRHGGRISLLSMGPPFFESNLRVALAMGADHIYLLSDKAFAGADTLATTYTLAQGVRQIGDVDLVFCGEESSDGATGQVPPGLAEWLDCCQLTLLTEISFNEKSGTARGRREIKGGYEILECPTPCVISVKTACNEPRFMDYALRTWALEEERLTVWDAGDVAADPGYIGLTGSPTVVTGLAEAPYRDRQREFLQGTNEQIIEHMVNLIRAGK
jgi:electron transfer flavoprotein beta subunit